MSTTAHAVMEVPSDNAPATVKQIYEDYERRREGLLKALSSDVDDFYQQCDPERENLCLYGHSDGSWSVDTPAEEVPPELPEPCLGINFARDGMVKKDWVALVAVHSDAWLIGLAYYYGILLDKDERETLFKRINSLPTLFEEVSGRAGPSKGAGASTSSKKAKKEHHPVLQPPRGRSLTAADVGTSLKGKKAELYWPDDGGWYAVEIIKVNTKSRHAMIQYATGEQEELDMDEIIKAGHMALLN